MHAAGKVNLNLGSLHMRGDVDARAAREYLEAAALVAWVGDRENSVMADRGLADALTAIGEFDETGKLFNF